MAGETILVISGPGVPPYSARGLTQTYEPIEAAIHLERAVNGEMVDLSIPAMRKYGSKVTCTDIDVPALSGVWPGAQVQVDCVFEFSFLTTNPAAQERAAVPGSTRVDGDFTFYRPRLQMVITKFSVSKDEYGDSVAWELDLEEQ